MKKDELLKETVDLARKFCASCENFEKQSQNIPVEDMRNKLLDLTRHAWEFLGFYRALTIVGILDGDDRKKICSIAFFGTSISSEVINFIEGLDGLDGLGKK